MNGSWAQFFRARDADWLDRHERVIEMMEDDNPSYCRWFFDADRCFDCGSQFIAHRCCMEDA